MDIIRGAPSPTAVELTTAEAERRPAEIGPNRALEIHEESFFEEFLKSPREPLVLLLLGVGVLYRIFGELSDVLVVLIETSTEFRASSAIATLDGLGTAAGARVFAFADSSR